jgi:hypothetical protein
MKAALAWMPSARSAGWLASWLATAVLVHALRSPAAALTASHVESLHPTPLPALRQHPAIQRSNKSFKALKTKTLFASGTAAHD